MLTRRVYFHMPEVSGRLCRPSSTSETVVVLRVTWRESGLNQQDLGGRCASDPRTMGKLSIFLAARLEISATSRDRPTGPGSSSAPATRRASMPAVPWCLGLAENLAVASRSGTIASLHPLLGSRSVVGEPIARPVGRSRDVGGKSVLGARRSIISPVRDRKRNAAPSCWLSPLSSRYISTTVRLDRRLEWLQQHVPHFLTI